MSDDYFDIKKLYPVMDKQGWTVGRNCMEFWANGNAKKALLSRSGGKSTVGGNVDSGLNFF